MFTGIVQAVFTVKTINQVDDELVVRVVAPNRWRLRAGESVAINGVCSTVRRVWAKSFSVAYIVPGSFELPLACQRLAEAKCYDALITLGCMIRGETDHYHYIMNELSRGVMNVMLRHKIPIDLGVIAAYSLKQAQERSRGAKNYGRRAANAALAMVL